MCFFGRLVCELFKAHSSLDAYIGYVLTLRIDINRARANIAEIKKRVSARIYAVVKADAYGHGAKLCKYIEDDVYGFAVSCRSEALDLINLGIKKPVLILCPPDSLEFNREPLQELHVKERMRTLPDVSETGNCLASDCTNIIYTVSNAANLDRLRDCTVALKVNSGMNRLGAGDAAYDALLKKIKSRPDLKLAEIFTHFYSTDGAKEQFEVFKAMTQSERDENEKAKDGANNQTRDRRILFHCCASNCLSLPSFMHLDAVRCGLAIYGYGKSMLPVLSAFTLIEQINTVGRGAHIGYGDFKAPYDMKVAVLKAGYADGFKRGQRRKIRINGKICNIVGSICMDLCFADVTNIDAFPGARAYLVDDVLNAEVLASEQGTVPYEILTSLSGKRIQRIYE